MKRKQLIVIKIDRKTDWLEYSMRV